MVKYSDEQLDLVFGALSDTNRRKVLQKLSQTESTVSELAELLDISLPGVMKHLGVLENAGLVSLSKEGRVRRCAFEGAPLRGVEDWIARYRQFWEHQLDGLEKFLKNRATRPKGEI